MAKIRKARLFLYCWTDQQNSDRSNQWIARTTHGHWKKTHCHQSHSKLLIFTRHHSKLFSRCGYEWSASSRVKKRGGRCECQDALMTNLFGTAPVSSHSLLRFKRIVGNRRHWRTRIVICGRWLSLSNIQFMVQQTYLPLLLFNEISGSKISPFSEKMLISRRRTKLPDQFLFAE